MVRKEIDISDMELENVIDYTASELMICYNCEKKTDGVRRIDTGIKNSKMIVRAKFDCETCGEMNNNYAELE